MTIYELLSENKASKWNFIHKYSDKILFYKLSGDKQKLKGRVEFRERNQWIKINHLLKFYIEWKIKWKCKLKKKIFCFFFFH